MVAKKKPRVARTQKRRRCPYAAQKPGDMGCLWTGADARAHVNTTCAFALVTCRNDGCNARRERRAMAEHAERCELRLEVCPHRKAGCNAPLMTPSKMGAHLEKAAHVHAALLAAKCDQRELEVREMAEAQKKAEADVQRAVARCESTTSRASSTWRVYAIEEKMANPKTKSECHDVLLESTDYRDTCVKIEATFTPNDIKVGLTPRLSHSSSSVVLVHNRDAKQNRSLKPADGCSGTTISKNDLKQFITNGAITIAVQLRPQRRKKN